MQKTIWPIAGCWKILPSPNNQTCQTFLILSKRGLVTFHCQIFSQWLMIESRRSKSHRPRPQFCFRVPHRKLVACQLPDWGPSRKEIESRTGTFPEQKMHNHCVDPISKQSEHSYLPRVWEFQWTEPGSLAACFTSRRKVKDAGVASGAAQQEKTVWQARPYIIVAYHQAIWESS